MRYIHQLTHDSKMSEEQSVKTAAMLIEDKFWNVIKFFFLQSRNKALNEKIDPSAYDVIANRFIVLASAESTKGKTFRGRHVEKE